MLAIISSRYQYGPFFCCRSYVKLLDCWRAEKISLLPKPPSRPMAFATSATAPLNPRQHGALQILYCIVLYCIVWLIRHWVYYSKDFARQSPTLARPTAPLATCVQWISSADKTNNTTRIHIVSISVDTVNEKRLPRQRPLRNWKTNVRLIVPSCGSVPSLKIRQRSVRSMLIEKKQLHVVHLRPKFYQSCKRREDQSSSCWDSWSGRSH